MRIFIALISLLGAGIASAATPTVTLTASPTTGVESVTPTLTWTSTGAISCTAGGGWSGTKATSGTQALPAVTATTTFSLTCSSAATTGTVTLNWTAPTQNTDGSALTDLASYDLFRDGTKIKNVLAPALTYDDTGLANGSYSYTIQSINAAGTPSVMSNAVTGTVTGAGIATGSASASVTVNKRPKPPVLVTVSQTAYQPRLFRNQFVWVAIGKAPLGTICDPDVKVAGLYKIPGSAVTPKTYYAFGKCG